MWRCSGATRAAPPIPLAALASPAHSAAARPSLPPGAAASPDARSRVSSPSPPAPAMLPWLARWPSKDGYEDSRRARARLRDRPAAPPRRCLPPGVGHARGRGPGLAGLRDVPGQGLELHRLRQSGRDRAALASRRPLPSTFTSASSAPSQSFPELEADPRLDLEDAPLPRPI